MKTIALLAIVTAQFAFGGTPTEALGAFRKAAQANRFDEAWKYSAKFDGVPGDVMEHEKLVVKRFVFLSVEGWTFDILEEKIDGDCAVVIVNDSYKGGQKNINPAYLIRQHGEWRTFPGISGWDIAFQGAKDKVDTYRKLDAWFFSRKTELEKKQKG